MAEFSKILQSMAVAGSMKSEGGSRISKVDDVWRYFLTVDCLQEGRYTV